jgi:hypothetical protein
MLRNAAAQRPQVCWLQCGAGPQHAKACNQGDGLRNNWQYAVRGKPVRNAALTIVLGHGRKGPVEEEDADGLVVLARGLGPQRQQLLLSPDASIGQRLGPRGQQPGRSLALQPAWQSQPGPW